jgi:hypothetical protein
MVQHLKIATHDLPDPESAVRAMRSATRELGARYPSIMAWRLAIGRSADGYEAHADVRLAQHQLIVNGIGEAPERALHQALAKLVAQLGALAQRDASVVYSAPAKAA